MKFCGDHWTALREKTIAAGLGALIAETGEDAARKVAREIEEGVTLDTFDPLMRAHMAILSNALDVAGLDLLQPNEDGTDRCPICYLNRIHDERCQGPPCVLPRGTAFDGWLERAVDEQVTVWRELQQ